MQQKTFNDVAKNLERIGAELKDKARKGLDFKWRELFNSIEEYCQAIDDGINDMLAYTAMFSHNIYDYVVLGMQLAIEDSIYAKGIR